MDCIIFFKVVTKQHRRILSKGMVWVAVNKVNVYRPLSKPNPNVIINS